MFQDINPVSCYTAIQPAVPSDDSFPFSMQNNTHLLPLLPPPSALPPLPTANCFLSSLSTQHSALSTSPHCQLPTASSLPSALSTFFLANCQLPTADCQLFPPCQLISVLFFFSSNIVYSNTRRMPGANLPKEPINILNKIFDSNACKS